MTKADLVERVAERTGLTRTDVAVVVDAFLETIKELLKSSSAKKERLAIRVPAKLFLFPAERFRFSNHQTNSRA